MRKYSTAIIGGGAAGICAAIRKARRNETVIICEKLPQIGKKILASGNGRCNLFNENLDESCYNQASRSLVMSIFERFGKKEIFEFFRELGLETYSQDGRIFPRTNQATSVLKVLDMELKRLKVSVELNFNCWDISFGKDKILVKSGAGAEIECRKLIVTGGGKAYPALGSDGGTHEIARKMGHTIITPVPSAVPLIVKDKLCHLLQGQRLTATARSVIDGKEGVEVKGELLFTKYGLSGTCVLDISEAVSIAINRFDKKGVFVSIDLVPFMDQACLASELCRRLKQRWAPGEMLTGILPNKISAAFAEIFKAGDTNAIAKSLKGYHFKVEDTLGWNEAEFTSGGIDTREVKPGTLESKLRKGVYFAGEVLDVNGKRGGYNLAWAWASGYVSGETS